MSQKRKHIGGQTVESSEHSPPKIGKKTKKLSCKTNKQKPVTKSPENSQKANSNSDRKEIITKFDKGEKKAFTKPSKAAPKKFKNVKGTKKGDLQEKPEDWNEFKKKKKELRLKRRQGKDSFDVITQAKKIGELLRKKILKNGEVERNKLINDLHNLLKNKGHYSKFVLAHDTARIVQWLLKFSSPIIREEISEEFTNIMEMMQSKYGIFCVKRLLKYGNTKTRSKVINSMYGNVVKLASHAVSASVFEYACSTWATPQQKYHLVQEFYGDIYKNSKDNNVKCLKDVFISSPDLKLAALSSTKANLNRILNKSLLDSGIVQTVLYQFLVECNAEDRAELISQLVAHIVVISNSKDGARAAMQCIWFGTNKDRKVIMKSLKEHLLELCKHEHGHCTIITLLDAADDTVLLNKIISNEILKNAKDLSQNEWGRKVLLWLVVPGNSSYFHPVFIKELNDGRDKSTSKKSIEIRRNEILTFSSSTLLNLVTSEPEFWLSDGKRAYEMVAFIKSATGAELEHTFNSIVSVITKLDWTVKENEKEMKGIEHAGIHMTLKKIAQNDKLNLEKNLPTLGSSLIKELSDEVIKFWLQTNRGCFVLVSIYENNSEDVQSRLKELLNSHVKFLKKQKEAGAKILLKKLT